MKQKTIEKIQCRVEAERPYATDLDSYAKIVGMEWELPPAWSSKEWVRKQVSTDGFDAIKMAKNIYDASSPKWEVLPIGLADREHAAELETALEWWIKRANKNGAKEPLRQALHYSCQQNRVIYSLDYLPYWLDKDKKKWTKEQKDAMRRSSFCLRTHDARTVYYETGEYGLKWVASIVNVTAAEIRDHWGAYSRYSEEATDPGNDYGEVEKTAKKIAAALAKISKLDEDDEDARFVLVDYCSLERREVAAFPTRLDTIADFENYDDETERVDIMDEKNDLDFIPWVVVEGEGTPMLYSLHKSGGWENQNLYNTLIDSTVMRRAVFPILQHTSPTGRALEVDYGGEMDVVELPSGEQAGVMSPPPIDPALSQLANTNIARISQTTGMRGLSSIEVAGNVQYAAVQAVVQLHMSNLQPYIRTVEKANAQLGDLCFRWIEAAGTTEVYWNETKKGEGMNDRGMGGAITTDKFDPDILYIECRLLANAPTDKQQLFNMYAQLKQAGAHISWKHIVDDKLNIGNGDVLEAEWLDEEAANAAMQMKVKELDAQLQMQMQQAQIQMQMQAQQAQMQQQMQQAQQMQSPQGMGGQVPPAQGEPMMPEGQAYNAAQGGQPTAPAVPGATSPV